MKLSFPFLLFAISIFGFHCKKNNPNSDSALPPATQTGQGVFACLVNGEPWISMNGRPDLGGNLTNDSLIVKGTSRLTDGEIETFVIYLLGTFRPGKKEYLLNDTVNSYILHLRSRNGNCFQNNASYGGVIQKIGNGNLTITKADSVSKILSGTFSFDLPTDFCGISKVTDGRFDIKYQ